MGEAEILSVWVRRLVKIRLYAATEYNGAEFYPARGWTVSFKETISSLPVVTNQTLGF